MDKYLIIVRNKLCHILVAVMSHTNFIHSWFINNQRSGRNGFGYVPDESKIDGVAVGGVKALDTEIIVVEEAVIGVGFGRRGLRPSRSLPVLDTPSYAVEGHDDVGRRRRRAACPEDGPVLTVVLDGPDARGGLDQRLVAVVVELGEESITQSHRGTEVGD